MTVEQTPENARTEETHYVSNSQKKNKRITLNLKKVQTKSYISNKNRCTISQIQIDENEMKTKTKTDDASNFLREPIQSTSAEQNVILPELVNQIPNADLNTDNSLINKQLIEQEIINDFDLTLMTVNGNTDISSTIQYREIVNSLQETTPTTVYNNTLNRNCRRCSKPIFYDYHTLECACNSKPIFHKMCVQLDWDVSKRSGIQFICFDCLTPIHHDTFIHNLDIEQIFTSIRNVQEKSDFLLR